MIEIRGKYNTAKVMIDTVDSEAVSQVMQLCNMEFLSDSNIVLMPDIHVGNRCTIGTTLTLKDQVLPSLIGVDIGCGVEVVKLKEKHLELQKLDKAIRERIPSGFDIRTKPHKYISKSSLNDLRCLTNINTNKAELSLGTLGGGNHFIEVDKSPKGDLYLLIHSGSRHLGFEVATLYIGRKEEVLSGELFNSYIHDVEIVQQFAVLNRQAIVDEILRGMKLHAEDSFTVVHNYIDKSAGILRKGAISAQKGERVIIPINMAEGSLLCEGKGNPAWNYSAPHGAGRILSRSETKESYTVSQFKKVMAKAKVYTTSISKSTLDECPMAYKPIEDILSNISDTVEIKEHLKSIYNFKGSSEKG